MNEEARPIVWLSSYPKSGSTWVRLFLAAMKSGDVDPNDPPLSTFASDSTPYFYQSVSPKPLGSMSQYEVLALRWAVLLHVLSVHEQRPVVCKTHHANFYAACGPLIPKELTAGVIYVMRDPRDVAVSMAHHTKMNIDKVIERMCDPGFALGDRSGPFHILGDWTTHVKSYVESDHPLLLLRYEDMVMKPKEAFTRVLDFLEVEVRRHFKSALEATRFGRLQLNEQAHGFREAKQGVPFFRAGKVGEWKNVLTDLQEQRLLQKHGELMRESGYL